jgi:hypothetical protein
MTPKPPSQQELQQERQRELLSRVGSTIRPHVTSVDGYRALQEPIAVSPYQMVALYRSADRPAKSRDIMLITEGTDAGMPAACGSELVAMHPGEVPEPEAECAANGGHWVRGSKSLHEVVERRGHLLIRALASKRVPLALLSSAVAHSQRMDDEHFGVVYLGH